MSKWKTISYEVRWTETDGYGTEMVRRFDGDKIAAEAFYEEKRSEYMTSTINLVRIQRR